MLGSFLQRRRDRRALDYSILTTPHKTFGRLDGLDEEPEKTDDAMLETLSEDVEQVDNEAIIAFLEGQVDTALKMLAEQNEIVEAARKLCLVMTQVCRKTGDAVFQLAHGEDQVAVANLNHRYSDLAALLQGGDRPVPPRLAEGTVH